MCVSVEEVVGGFNVVTTLKSAATQHQGVNLSPPSELGLSSLKNVNGAEVPLPGDRYSLGLG